MKAIETWVMVVVIGMEVIEDREALQPCRHCRPTETGRKFAFRMVQIAAELKLAGLKQGHATNHPAIPVQASRRWLLSALSLFVLDLELH